VRTYPSFRIAALTGFVVIAGCESDGEKTERLRSTAQDDCLVVSLHEANPNAAAPNDAQRSKCESSRTAFNAHLEGR